MESPDGDGWTTVPVKGKYAKKIGRKTEHHIQKARDLIHEPDGDEYEVSEEKERMLLRKIVSEYTPAIKQTKLYQLIWSLINTESRFERIIVLGVGRLMSDASMLQLALTVALKDDLSNFDFLIECVVSDPILRPTDKRILKALDIKVNEENVKGKLICDKNTLLFMPHCPYRLYSNVLWANWGEHLGNVTILGNRSIDAIYFAQNES